MAYSAYSQLLRTPMWQRKKNGILERDNYTCQECGDTETELQVHHKWYAELPWDVPDDALITLCKNCHSDIEMAKQQEKRQREREREYRECERLRLQRNEDSKRGIKDNGRGIRLTALQELMKEEGLL